MQDLETRNLNAASSKRTLAARIYDRTETPDSGKKFLLWLIVCIVLVLAIWAGLSQWAF